MHIKVDKGVVVRRSYSAGELRKDNPQTSFPSDMGGAFLAQWGVYPLNPTAPAPYDSMTHTVVEEDPVFVDGAWVQVWRVQALPNDEVEKNLQQCAQAVRAERDQLLAASDWVVTKAYEKQEPVPVGWAQYRQQLRDIPQQQDFPLNVIWPVAP